MRILSTVLTAVSIMSVMTISSIVAPAEAAGRNSYNRSGDVVVTQGWGFGPRVAGRVRNTRLGPQVQLPGGTWVYCIRSCAETLRVNTVDFWDTQEDPSGNMDERGLLIYIRP